MQHTYNQRHKPRCSLNGWAISMPSLCILQSPAAAVGSGGQEQGSQKICQKISQEMPGSYVLPPSVDTCVGV